jgi:hypothetical protein
MSQLRSDDGRQPPHTGAGRATSGLAKLGLSRLLTFSGGGAPSNGLVPPSGPDAAEWF